MMPSGLNNSRRARNRTISPGRSKLHGGAAAVRAEIKAGTYWERQQSAACGRHALNNLFGTKIFIADDKSEITDATFQTLGTKVPISLQSLCRYLSKDERYGDKGTDGKLVPLACPPEENYDNLVLEAALGVLGYKGGIPNTIEGVPIRDWKNIHTNDKDVIGYIVNFGAGHWVAYRKLPDGKYKYINSSDDDDIKHSKPPHGLVDTLDNLKARHRDRIEDVIEIKFMGHFIGKMDGIPVDPGAGTDPGAGPDPRQRLSLELHNGPSGGRHGLRGAV